MHVLYLARLVLVQLASKFKLCRFLYTKKRPIRFVCFASRFCTFGYNVSAAFVPLFF